MKSRSRLTWLLVTGILALAACARILGYGQRNDAAFPHRKHVLRGIPCTQCHQGMEQAQDQGPLHIPAPQSCQTSGCHAKPHDPAPCLNCHVSATGAADAARARDNLRFSHAKHMTPANGNCARCHVGVHDGDTPLRPPMAACWNCHEHERVRDVRDCSACHIDLGREATPPMSHIVHEDDFAATHGRYASAAADTCASCHAERFCASCHGVTAPTLPARTALGNPFAASVHTMTFFPRHGEQARTDAASCTSCHRPDACSDCHQRSEVASKRLTGQAVVSPHPRGWVGVGVGNNDHGLAARRDPVTCASCHSGPGEMLCVGCHAVGGPGGTPHPPGWSSNQPLASLPCRLCHPIGAR